MVRRPSAVFRTPIRLQKGSHLMETGPKDTPIPAEASSSRSEDREALTRRAFLKQAAFATAAMAAPFPVLADPYAPQSGTGTVAGVQPARAGPSGTRHRPCPVR